MFNRPHPGEVLAENLGPDGLGLKVSEAALTLGVSRVQLSRVLHGHASITPAFALRLEANNLGSAELWLRMQMRYDLERAREAIAQ